MIRQTPAQNSRQADAFKFLFLFPAILFAVFKLFPIFYESIMAFKSFKALPFTGSLWDSPWAGSQNFQHLFQLISFPAALNTSFVYGLLQLIFGALCSLLAAVFFRKGRSATVCGVVFSAAMFFSFLPEQFLFQFVLSSGIAVQSNFYAAAYAAAGMIRQIGPAVLAGGAGSLLASKSNRKILRLGGALLYISLLVSQLFSNQLALFELLRPYTLNHSLVGLLHRAGILEMNFSDAAAIRTVMNLLQLLPTLGTALFLVLAMRNDVPVSVAAPNQRKHNGPLLLFVMLGAAFAGCGIVSIFISKQADRDLLPRAAFYSLLVMFIGFFVFLVYTLTGALAASACKRPWVPAFLLIFTGINVSFVSEYLLVQKQMMLNTVFAPAILSAFSIVPLAAIISFLFFLNRKQGLLVSLPLFGLAASSILTNLLYPLICISDLNQRGLSYYAYSFLYYVTEPGNDTSAAGRILLFFSLGLWAFSCISLFRLTTKSPEQPSVSDV